MTLEEIAVKMSQVHTLGEQEMLLSSLGRVQHIRYETGESEKLASENPMSFINVGMKTLDRASYGKTDEEYKNACIMNAKFLYERFPLIFEFYDELTNGSVKQNNQVSSAEVSSLEEIAVKMSRVHTLGEQEMLLSSLGRVQHIRYETGESEKLASENPMRFINVGMKTLDRVSYGKTDEEYKNACIMNAKFLYERFPLIFEFYDELANGIVINNNLGSIVK